VRSRPSLIAVVLALTLTLLFAGAAQAEAPQVNTPASITGTAAVGQELTAHNGTWLYADGTSCQSECTMSYQWQRCSGGCADISGASTRFYTVQSADAGHTLRVMETMAKYDCGAWNNAAGTQECHDITRSGPSGQVVPPRRLRRRRPARHRRPAPSPRLRSRRRPRSRRRWPAFRWSSRP
jgi:hypothetical protein